MSFIALWLLKIRYKKGIKEIRKNNTNTSDSMALESLVGDVGKLKRKIRIINIALIAIAIVVIMTISTILFSLFAFTSNFTSVASNVISNLLDTKKKDEGKEDGSNWEWEKHDGDQQDNLNGSGGLYPKDPILKNRAKILEVIQKSSDDAKKYGLNNVEPAWVLGSIYRENGNRIYSLLDGYKLDVLKDLIIQNPACGKGSNCAYMSGGTSHYYKGSVSGGRDTGDPHKMIINPSMSLYNAYGGDHAIGILQFEIPYLYGHLTRMYGNTTKVLTGDTKDANNILAKSKMDSKLGFIRPNPAYAPDMIYNSVFSLASKPTVNGSSYNSIINSADFKSLSEYNQNFIKWMYASSGYGRGNVTSTDDQAALALIKLAKSGKIKNLDDMVSDKLSTYWDANKKQLKGSWKDFVHDVNSRYGLGLQETYYMGGYQYPCVYWYGIYAANVGKVAYTQMKTLIDKAEKEGGINIKGSGTGNWVGSPGSGIFGDGGSKYYLKNIGIRWYNQTSQVNQYSQHWGSLPITNGGTMADSGCGIYTMAMIASNLLNKDITPDVIYRLIPPQYKNGCMYDQAVPIICKKYGLKMETLNYYGSDCELKVKKALKQGKMVLFVSKYGPNPWYYGDGHFMALRGVTSDGKYLGISSVGSRHWGTTPEQLMKVAITHSTWVKSLDPIRNYVWIIGV